MENQIRRIIRKNGRRQRRLVKFERIQLISIQTKSKLNKKQSIKMTFLFPNQLTREQQIEIEVEEIDRRQRR